VHKLRKGLFSTLSIYKLHFNIFV